MPVLVNTKSVFGILLTLWVMGFLIYKQKGSFFLPRATGIQNTKGVCFFSEIRAASLSLAQLADFLDAARESKTQDRDGYQTSSTTIPKS